MSTFNTCLDSSLTVGDDDNVCCRLCCRELFPADDILNNPNDDSYISCIRGCDDDCTRQDGNQEEVIQLCQNTGIQFYNGDSEIHSENSFCCVFDPQQSSDFFLEPLGDNLDCSEIFLSTYTPTSLSKEKNRNNKLTFIFEYHIIFFLRRRRVEKSSEEVSKEFGISKFGSLSASFTPVNLDGKEVSVPIEYSISNEKEYSMTELKKDMDKGIKRQKEEVPEFLKIFQHKKVPIEHGKNIIGNNKKSETKKEDDDGNIESIGFSVI
eukprot:snap_masked-scaffold_45-processed-gene-1.79-mRNA-1 protein AED:1.00 eAED:1.00 QI:0/0/0/0/1/1/3/0/265